MDRDTKHIRAAVEKVGSQIALANTLKVPASLVSQWCTGHRPVAAKHCIGIEQATNGAVTRYQLLPGVFCAPQQRAG